MWLRTLQALGSPGIVASDGSYVRLLEGSALVWKLQVVSGLWGCSQLPGRICIRFWLNCTDKESGLIFINGKGGNKTFCHGNVWRGRWKYQILKGEGCSMFPQTSIIKYINILQGQNNATFHIFMKSWICGDGRGRGKHEKTMSWIGKRKVEEKCRHFKEC